MIIVCPKVGLSKGEGASEQRSSGDLKERLGVELFSLPLPFTAKDIDMQI